MSIFDMFKQAPVEAPAPQQQAAPPGNISDQPTPSTSSSEATAPNGTIPAESAATAGAASVDNSPLAQFKGLWETGTQDGNKQEPTFGELKVEDVQTAVAKADFSGAITQEQLAAISAGGEEATTAFTQALQSVARQVLTQSTLVSNNLAKKAIREALEQHSEQLPSMLRAQSVNTYMADSDPILKHPAIKPVVEATSAQLTSQYPDATPAEITQMTVDYIKAMGGMFAPKDTSGGVSGTDWEKFLTS